MDLNILRSAVTVLSFLTFIAIAWRIWRRGDLEQSARVALLDDGDTVVPAEGAPR